jgi:molybdenum cofactor sulfurtransferase
MLPNSFIEHAASSQNISLRTGCMCNPGGAAALLGREDDMLQLYEGVTHRDFEANHQELGVVRVSLGLATSFQDVWRVIRFAATLGSELHRQVLWDRWNGATTSSHGNWQGSKRHQAESWSGGSSSEHNNYGS